MANIMIKNDDRLQYEAFCGRQFGADASKAEHREYQERIAARTKEAVQALKKGMLTKRW